MAHSKPNNMTLSAFPGKIPKIKKKNFLIFYPSPNVAPKPTYQSRSNSIFWVPLHYLHSHKKKLNIRFSKKWLQF